MRRKKINTQTDKLVQYVIIMGLAFSVFIACGSLLNKIYPQAQNLIMSNIEPTVNYYNSDISIKEVLLSNFKPSLIFMITIYILSLLVLTFPIVLIGFALKGMSIGYTVNSLILGLKFSSIKFVIITLLKNIILIPGAFILTIISIKYVFEIIKSIKTHNNKDKIKFYIKQYTINSAIIILGTVLLQTIINAISIATLQILI